MPAPCHAAENRVAEAARASARRQAGHAALPLVAPGADLAFAVEIAFDKTLPSALRPGCPRVLRDAGPMPALKLTGKNKMRAALLTLSLMLGGAAVAQETPAVTPPASGEAAPVVPSEAPAVPGGALEAPSAPSLPGAPSAEEAAPSLPGADAAPAAAQTTTPGATTPTGAETGTATEAAPAATGTATAPGAAETPAVDPAATDAAPAATGAATPAAAAAPAAEAEAGLPVMEADLWEILKHAHWVVLWVMIGLAAAAFAALVIFIHKMAEYMLAFGKLKKAARTLRDAPDLQSAAQMLATAKGPAAEMVRAADKELRLGVHEAALLPGVHGRSESSLSRIETGAAQTLRSATGILASIGSLSPFVGLFGTVFGIMNSFLAIAATKTTNLAVVAPGIAEALFATAIGLAAAIPAVLIYNVCGRLLAKYRVGLGDVGAAVLRLQSRELDRIAAAGV